MLFFFFSVFQARRVLLLIHYVQPEAGQGPQEATLARQQRGQVFIHPPTPLALGWPVDADTERTEFSDLALAKSGTEVISSLENKLGHSALRSLREHPRRPCGKRCVECWRHKGDERHNSRSPGRSSWVWTGPTNSDIPQCCDGLGKDPTGQSEHQGRKHTGTKCPCLRRRADREAAALQHPSSCPQSDANTVLAGETQFNDNTVPSAAVTLRSPHSVLVARWKRTLYIRWEGI